MDKLIGHLPKIEKETEKAYMLDYQNYEYTNMSYNKSTDDVEYNPVYRAVWVPKSQVIVEDNKIVAMPSWLAKKIGLKTEKMESDRQERINKYESLIFWAKQNGLKVKNKMKKSTILEVIKKAGLTVPAELI